MIWSAPKQNYSIAFANATAAAGQHPRGECGGLCREGKVDLAGGPLVLESRAASRRPVKQPQGPLSTRHYE
jgi:hypothetical protein